MNFKRDIQTITRTTGFFAIMGTAVGGSIVCPISLPVMLRYHHNPMDIIQIGALGGLAMGVTVGFCVGVTSAFLDELKDCLEQTPKQNLRCQ